MPSREALLQRIDTYLNTIPRAACDIEQVEPFTLFFRRDSVLPELSYARPTARLSGDLKAEIAAVRAAFAARSRVCRWEFLADLFPTLPESLMQSGFPEPLPRPLMVVTRATKVRRIGADETRVVSRVLQEAFGVDDSEPTESADDDLLASLLSRGASAYAAFVDGRPVSGGLHSPVGETTEVAGIGTLAEFRRRGIAGALTSALIADALDRGCECIFLSAADETVQRVYARLGFEKIGTAMDTADAA
jgi:ribosomal protein S18 acetylase RimI-like enzyme